MRRWLIKFRKLLEEAGVEKVVRPTQLQTSLTDSETTLAKMRSCGQTLRASKLLADVVISSSWGASNDNQYPAHRVILAMASEYFWDAFQDWTPEGRPTASPKDPAILEVDHSEHAISACLGIKSCLFPLDISKSDTDFIYNGSYPLKTSETRDLIDIIHLSNYWMLFDLHQNVQSLLIDKISLKSWKWSTHLLFASLVNAGLTATQFASKRRRLQQSNFAKHVTSSNRKIRAFCNRANNTRAMKNPRSKRKRTENLLIELVDSRFRRAGRCFRLFIFLPIF